MLLFIGCQFQSSPSTLLPHRPDQHIDRLPSFLACSCTGPSLDERRWHILSPALILQCLSPFGKHTKPFGLSPPNTAKHRLFWPDNRFNRSRCCGALSNEIPNTGIRHSISVDQLVLALTTPQPFRCRYIPSSTLSSDWPMPSEVKARKAWGLRIRGSAVACRRQWLQLVSVTGPRQAFSHLGLLIVDSIAFDDLPVYQAFGLIPLNEPMHRTVNDPWSLRSSLWSKTVQSTYESQCRRVAWKF